MSRFAGYKYFTVKIFSIHAKNYKSIFCQMTFEKEKGLIQYSRRILLITNSCIIYFQYEESLEITNQAISDYRLKV